MHIAEVIIPKNGSRQVIIVESNGVFSAHAELADGTALPAYGLRGKVWLRKKSALRAAQRYLERFS